MTMVIIDIHSKKHIDFTAHTEQNVIFSNEFQHCCTTHIVRYILGKIDLFHNIALTTPTYLLHKIISLPSFTRVYVVPSVELKITENIELCIAQIMDKILHVVHAHNLFKTNT